MMNAQQQNECMNLLDGSVFLSAAFAASSDSKILQYDRSQSDGITDRAHLLSTDRLIAAGLHAPVFFRTAGQTNSWTQRPGNQHVSPYNHLADNSLYPVVFKKKKILKMSLCLKQHHAMNKYGEVDLQLLGTRWRREVSFATVVLPRQKASPGTQVPARKRARISFVQTVAQSLS